MCTLFIKFNPEEKCKLAEPYGCRILYNFITDLQLSNKKAK